MGEGGVMEGTHGQWIHVSTSDFLLFILFCSSRVEGEVSGVTDGRR